MVRLPDQSSALIAYVLGGDGSSCDGDGGGYGDGDSGDGDGDGSDLMVVVVRVGRGVLLLVGVWEVALCYGLLKMLVLWR